MKLKPLIIIYILSGFFSVAFGAFGSHILKNKVPDDLMNIFEISNKYQFMHTFAGLIALIFFKIEKNKWLYISAIVFLLGIIFFSGSLYTMVFTGYRKLGAITPIGGVLFLLGWLSMGIGILKSRI
jgi:uncharacterized membrane protein YgdD (TMEM256/DUF423 family)